MANATDTLEKPAGKRAGKRGKAAAAGMKKGAAKAKGAAKKLKLFSGLKMKDLVPEAPAIANFTTGEVMGHSSDRLADRFSVSRREQDEFALRSHHNAAKAHADGLYADEIIPVTVKSRKGSTEVTTDEEAATAAKPVSTAKPAFKKENGTVTAANASTISDGAAAVLLMSRAAAEACEACSSCGSMLPGPARQLVARHLMVTSLWPEPLTQPVVREGDV